MEDHNKIDKIVDEIYTENFDRLSLEMRLLLAITKQNNQILQKLK